jgi:hypothetical protein
MKFKKSSDLKQNGRDGLPSSVANSPVVAF